MIIMCPKKIQNLRKQYIYLFTVFIYLLTYLFIYV